MSDKPITGTLRTPRNRRDRGTRIVLGKTSHWMEDDAGKLHLFPGPALGEGLAIASQAARDLIDGSESLGGALDRLGVPKS